MSDLSLSRPEVFLAKIHPISWQGNVVFERKFSQSSSRQALVSSLQAHKSAKRLQNFSGNIYVSVSSFYGMPFIVNFEKTHALFADIKITDSAANTNTRVYNALDQFGIPLPNMVISDSETSVYLWYLEQPFLTHELHKVLFCHKVIFEALNSHGIDVISSEKGITGLIRLLGTRNPNNNVHMGLYKPGNSYSRERFDSAFLNHISPSAMENMKNDSDALIDLSKILRHRALDLSQNQAKHSDYLIAFSIALSKLCTKQQLLSEIRAVTETLFGGTPWDQLPTDAKECSIDIATSIIETGKVNANGITLDLSWSNWIPVFTDVLDVTESEVSSLGLRAFVPNNSNFQLDFENLSTNNRNAKPIGSQQFVSLDLLLAKVA